MEDGRSNESDRDHSGEDEMTDRQKKVAKFLLGAFKEDLDKLCRTTQHDWEVVDYEYNKWKKIKGE